MELRHPLFATLGLIIAFAVLILFVLTRVKKDKCKSEIKLANAELLLEDKLYKRTVIEYAVLKTLLVCAVIVSIAASFALLARPYYLKKIKKEQYNRDIMITIDISSSVDDLNVKLVKELQDTVRSLSGERVGIVIFNTSPVLLSPLTDDYEYIIEQLEKIRLAIKGSSHNKIIKTVSADSNWLKNDNFLYGGTLVGNVERGSSLIGDGLMGGLINFTKDSDDRTKIIIFSTDNDKNGEGYLTLKEAAEYCKKKDVTVYGIGTKLMYGQDQMEMKEAVELTGGKFFLEESEGTFKNIVDEIESKSASLVEGKTIFKEVESPEKLFKILVISVIVIVITSILLRRQNLCFIIGAVVVAVCLILTYILAVLPAHKYSQGPDFEVKKSSDYKVLFVIDDTLSMLANDGPEGKERLAQVKEDMNEIIDELDGARFGVISFNNDAKLMMPFNNNAVHAKNVIGSIYPIDSYYASGTVNGTALDLMLTTINEDEKGKVAAFYVSDGEVTNVDTEAKSFEAVKKLIDAGAVLGYGSSEGGTMKVASMYDDSYTEVLDYSSLPFEPAISKIDETNLKKIAGEMDLPYVNMNSRDGLSAVVKTIKNNLEVKEEIIEADEEEEQYIKYPENNGYWMLLPVIILLLANAAYLIKKR